MRAFTKVGNTKTKIIATGLASMLLLSACQTTGGDKQAGGTLVGAGLGALAGSQIGSGRGKLVAIALGTLGGAFMGQSVGRSLDRADRLAMGQAQDTAASAPIGTPISWRNPDSGHYGVVTPVREGRQEATGAYCREYQKSVTIGGQTQNAYGTACRQPDGSWKIS
jgi:surface antigen